MTWEAPEARISTALSPDASTSNAQPSATSATRSEVSRTERLVIPRRLSWRSELGSAQRPAASVTTKSIAIRVSPVAWGVQG